MWSCVCFCLGLCLLGLGSMIQLVKSGYLGGISKSGEYIFANEEQTNTNISDTSNASHSPKGECR